MGVENVGWSEVPFTLETNPEAMLDPICTGQIWFVQS